jgi:prepilin-type N-terminal cleavage/methylation domain-containing protein
MKDERGFTIVELLVAVVLLSVILLPLIGYLNQARMISAEAHLEGEAMRLSQTYMENLLSLPWNSIQSGIQNSELETPFEKIEWVVTNEGNTQLKRIEVSVDWRDSRGNVQSYSLVTFRTSR